MTQEQFDAWIAELKKPETKKGQGILKDEAGRMCCLGVLACINNIQQIINTQNDRFYIFVFENGPYDQANGYTIPTNWMGISRSHAGKLAQINDSSDTFDQVIKYLERNKKEFITE